MKKGFYIRLSIVFKKIIMFMKHHKTENNFDIYQIIFSFKFIGTKLTNIKIVYLLKGTLL